MHGLVVIGVHTPEFAFEKEQSNVEKAVRDLEGHLSRGHRQRLHDLAGLQQRILAGALFHRRARDAFDTTISVKANTTSRNA